MRKSKPSLTCDICGCTEGVTREIYVNDLNTNPDAPVQRIFDLCKDHWIEAFRLTVWNIVDRNEYRFGGLLKETLDAYVMEAISNRKEPIAEECIVRHFKEPMECPDEE